MGVRVFVTCIYNIGVILNTSVQQNNPQPSGKPNPPSQLVENLRYLCGKAQHPVETVGNLWENYG